MTHDLAGRLETVTDAKNQVKTHSYFTDGQLKEITYTASQIPTPNVSFTYDPIYGRLQTMTDGTGLTQYAYHPVDGSTFGAGNLHTIDGPLADDTIAHTYDALGRMKTQSINGAANTTTIDNYDALGRVTQFTNPLGAFSQTYDPVNLMPKTVTAPNGLTTTLDYHTATADLRLKEIKHTLTGDVPLSKHVYAYKPAGNIKSWEQTLDTNPAKTWAIAYDKADQLEAATLTDTTAAVLEQHAWRYDRIGNRTSRQNGPQVTQSAHNSRNQITSEQPGGWMRVRGTTDEPATVRVKSNANPFTNAATDDTGEFSAWVQAAPGANTFTIEAKDFSPNANTRTNSWSIDITGQSRVPTYDDNGNTTSNGTGQTYDWDAENRLVKIIYADNSSTEFTYDGFSRRVRITEKNSSNTITSDKRYLWAGGNQPAEERAADGTTVLKQYHPQGEYIPAASAPLDMLFYTRDHLGSVRELVEANGTLQTRYDYDMWGKRTKLSGTLETEVGYTGHHHHAKSGLVLTWFRAYAAETGRWLSADPLGEAGGLNLYGYVLGDPINGWDPYGLEFWAWNGTAGAWAENITTFAAGYSDSATFGLTDLARDVLYQNHGGDTVNKCSDSYKSGETAQIATDVATLGASGGLKLALKAKGKQVARAEANRAIRNLPRTQHHINTVIGHPGGIASHFPTGGLPASIHSGSWNLRQVAPGARRGQMSPEHLGLHRRARLAENAAMGSAALVPGRGVRNSMQSDCD